MSFIGNDSLSEYPHFEANKDFITLSDLYHSFLSPFNITTFNPTSADLLSYQLL